MVVVDGFRYELSTKRDKKLQVFVNGRWVHFGQVGYQHYFDRTKLLNKNLNHKDSERRRLYLARASRIKKANGRLAADDVNSPNYHAIRILW